TGAIGVGNIELHFGGADPVHEHDVLCGGMDIQEWTDQSSQQCSQAQRAIRIRHQHVNLSASSRQQCRQCALQVAVIEILQFRPGKNTTGLERLDVLDWCTKGIVASKYDLTDGNHVPQGGSCDRVGALCDIVEKLPGHHPKSFGRLRLRPSTAIGTVKTLDQKGHRPTRMTPDHSDARKSSGCTTIDVAGDSSRRIRPVFDERIREVRNEAATAPGCGRMDVGQGLTTLQFRENRIEVRVAEPPVGVAREQSNSMRLQYVETVLDLL